MAATENVALPPEQTMTLAGCVAITVEGLTVTVNVAGIPPHPFAVGVIVIVDVIGAVVAFVTVNEGIFPEPLAARPIAVLLFVHVNVVPLTGPDKFVIDVVAPAQ